jgi:hypothetical protein
MNPHSPTQSVDLTSKPSSRRARSAVPGTVAILFGAVVAYSSLVRTNTAADLPNASFPLSPPPPGPALAIIGASVVDVIEGSVIPDAVVVVQGDRIAEVGPAKSVNIPDGARTLRLDGQYLIPGLINSHVFDRKVTTSGRAPLSAAAMNLPWLRSSPQWTPGLISEPVFSMECAGDHDEA